MNVGNNEKREESLMNSITKKIARYQVFTANGCQGIQDLRGNYRLIWKKDNGKWEILERESKPKVFQTFNLLTREQMEWDAFFQGYTVNYVPTRRFSEARTREERAEIWEEQRVYREGLEGQGYRLIDLNPGEWYLLEIPLKIHDYVTLEHLKRIDFEVKNRPVMNQENVNV